MADPIVNSALQYLNDQAHPTLMYQAALRTDSATPSPTSVIGDFTETTFSGYSRQSIVWPSSSTVPTNTAEAVSNNMVFGPFTGGGSVIITGYFVVDNGGALVAAGNFLSPITLDAVTNPAMILQLTLDALNG